MTPSNPAPDAHNAHPEAGRAAEYLKGRGYREFPVGHDSAWAQSAWHRRAEPGHTPYSLGKNFIETHVYVSKPFGEPISRSITVRVYGETQDERSDPHSFEAYGIALEDIEEQLPRAEARLLLAWEAIHDVADGPLAVCRRCEYVGDWPADDPCEATLTCPRCKRVSLFRQDGPTRPMAPEVER